MLHKIEDLDNFYTDLDTTFDFSTGYGSGSLLSRILHLRIRQSPTSCLNFNLYIYITFYPYCETVPFWPGSGSDFIFSFIQLRFLNPHTLKKFLNKFLSIIFLFELDKSSLIFSWNSSICSPTLILFKNNVSNPYLGPLYTWNKSRNRYLLYDSGSSYRLRNTAIYFTL
jgi:hypothetical protein